MKNMFLEISSKKCVTKAGPRLLFNSAKQTKTAIACKKILLKIRCSE